MQQASLHYAIIFLLILLTSCGSKKTASNIQHNYSGKDTIEINSNYPVFDVTHKFLIELDSIISDSRCPKGSQCVWAGNANIRLKATMVEDNETHFLDLNTNPQFNQDTVINNYQFKLLDITPYPENEKTFPYYDYRATIAIEKL